MQVIYASGAQEDRDYWQKNNPHIILRIDKLINDIGLHPYSGIGKPEMLRFSKHGYWSRRINAEHRLAYKVVDKIIYVAQCRYHYG
jgi:toxin YoeB